MPVSLNRDVSTFSVCFTKACRKAGDLLFRSGNAEPADEACRRATVEKLLPNALYVHRDALDSLEPPLGVYEGCARAYLGEVEGANLIKLHRHSGKVSKEKTLATHSRPEQIANLGCQVTLLMMSPSRLQMLQIPCPSQS